MITRRSLVAALAASPAIAARRARAATALRSKAMGLSDIAAAHGVTYGAAVQSDLIASDAQYADLVVSQCALVMPAYEAKFALLQPTEAHFNFDPLDTLIEWSHAHGKIMRGHGLIWHQQIPDWALAALKQGPARARQVMEAHLGHVLAHTARAIRAWDVVNEPIADPPGSDTPQAAGEMRNGPWLEALGPGYVDLALRIAHDHDPALRIAVNEYGVEEETPYCIEKRRRLLALVRHLKSTNVPLDAVGIQGHLQMVRPFNPATFTAYCRELRAEGVELVITEMDVREHWKIPHDYVARDKMVADRVKSFLDAAFEGGVRTVITWGVVDRYSWLVSDPGVARTDGLQHRGLPFDWEGHPKQYWQAMVAAIDAVPAR